MVNIITRKTLLDYAEKYPIAANALFECYHNFINKNYKTMNEYGKSSSMAINRCLPPM